MGFDFCCSDKSLLYLEALVLSRTQVKYVNGIGVDVHDWGGGAMIVKDTSNLPFMDETFDTITLIACLNHIPYREAVLRETHRLIKPGGQLIITMIDPILGDIGHTLW